MPDARSSRRLLLAALVVYSMLLAVALLAPTSEQQSGLVRMAREVGLSLGVPRRLVTPPRAEFVCNALILMPVSALGSLVWPRTTWRDWTAYAFVVASAVELTQGLFLPMRTPSYVDIVANALGGLGGALVVLVGRRVAADLQPPPAPPSPPSG